MTVQNKAASDGVSGAMTKVDALKVLADYRTHLARLAVYEIDGIGTAGQILLKEQADVLEPVLNGFFVRLEALITVLCGQLEENGSSMSQMHEALGLKDLPADVVQALDVVGEKA